MQNSKEGFFLLLLIVSISASLGFTGRSYSNSGRHDINGEQVDYTLSDNSSNYLENEISSSDQLNLFFLSDTTDSISNALLNSSDSLLSDSLLADSVVAIDSMALDSTARLKYFHYDQPDNYSTNVSEGYKSNLFIYPSKQHIQRSVELDSTGQFVLIKEKIAGQDTKVALKMPLSDYIDKMIDAVNKQGIDNLGRKYELVGGKKDLGKLLTDITNIDIPLPSASFLSIFGPPKISLKINGAVDIHGAWRNETTEGQTVSRLGNTRNEPDFSQQVQISVNGSIGDKLTINADWNTERTFEYENQLRLSYKGYDDEIIQSIEAGNVSLQTSPLIGGSEALFGVKAKFQFGPFTLTALASQKKGEIKEVSVSGGSKKQEFEISAANYSDNHYFLDAVYANTDEQHNFFNNYYGNATAIETDSSRKYFVKELEVWRTASGSYVETDKQRKVNAFIDLPSIPVGNSIDPSYKDASLTSEAGRSIINNYFEPLVDGIDYVYNPYTGYISFKTNIQKSDGIAVAYRIEGEGGVNLQYGEFITNLEDSAVAVLKLIKPDHELTPESPAWNLKLRNIYPLGGREINEEEFKLDIYYEIAGQEPRNDYNGVKLLENFGFDFYDDSKNPKPDGAFDFMQKTIMPETGEIIFPVLQPFGEDLPAALPDTIAYQNVYNKTKTFAREDRTKDKFRIKGSYSAATSSTFQIGFNVVENSVRVTLDGRELKAGVDYSVDYNIGQISIRNEAALVPGAKLSITYEQNDLFQLASKTLLGFRGIYEFSKKTNLGFSFLNLNQKSLSDKVRIGEEPLNNSIYGVDFGTSADLPFITAALDKVISTSTKSTFTLKGEAAYMSPDPNTKKSTIASDNGESIAYIDDFEGSKRTIPIGISYTTWKDASIPNNLPDIGDLPKEDQMDYKGKSFWFNILPSNVTTDQIWPEKDVPQKDRDVTVMDYIFRPDDRGMYNYEPDQSDPTKMWGGMMKGLSSSANNLIEEKIEAIEFWINIKNVPEDAKLKIDLGMISEDVIPNNEFDSEDKNFNSIVDEGEDTGIDGIRSSQEPGYDAANNKDPAGDNFRLRQNNSGVIYYDDFYSVNGTEGNAALSDIGKFPDSEDLNGNNNLDKTDSYFRYDIPLDTSKLANPFVSGGGAIIKRGNPDLIGKKSTWYQFKIPLKDFAEKIGSPTFALVEFIRLWVTGVDEEIHFQITEFNLVGNQWQKVIAPPRVTEDDSVLTVSNVSIEENPDYYSPKGLARERDRTQIEENILKNEQSLDLIINNLEDGEHREVVKYLIKGMDVFNYSKMKLFVHGDLDSSLGSISYYDPENPNDYATDMYFRFGSDSTNYYEYIRPVRPRWHEISINFDELTAIKELRPVDSLTSVYRIPVPGKPEHYYGIRGNPSLTKVTSFAFGIDNPKEKGDPMQSVSGRLWVNELRVLGANDTPGYAFSGSSSLNFADLLSVSANYRQTDPYFHKLGNQFGSRVDSRSWGVSSSLDIIKMLPVNLPGSNLKVNYSHTESQSKPLYKPQTDILVEKAAAASSNPDSLREETHTINVSDTWSVSNIKLKIPSKKWYIDDTFNGLVFSYNYNSSEARSPSVKASNSWLWNASGKYSVSFSKENFIYPANIPIIGWIFQLFSDYRNFKLYYTPQKFDAGITAKRNYSYSQSRNAEVAPNIRRDFNSSRNASFNWQLTNGGFLNLSTSYTLNVASSLAYLLTDEFENPRQEKDVWNDIFNGHMFGKDNNYGQSISLNSKPKMPSLLSLDKFLTLTASYSISYNWRNNFAQPRLGRSVGWSNRINSSLTVKVKSIMDPVFKLFGGDSKQSLEKPRSRSKPKRGQGRNVDKQIKEDDEANKAANSTTDSLAAANKPSIFNNILGVMLNSIQYVLFDYDQFSFNFSQNNSMGNSGMLSERTGFGNFWGGAQDLMNGPSRLYQLGLSSDPGPRAIGGTLSNNFSQKNNFTIKTSRPLWEGADIDVNWNVGWGYNESISLYVDSLSGEHIITNRNVSGNINRSFMSLPIVGASVSKVNELYDPNADDQSRSLSDAFVTGMESIPLLANIPFFNGIAQYIPRPNWRINWSGLEKLPIFENFFKRASLNHAYTSTYMEGWKINTNGIEEVQTQKVSYGFAPLVGLNLTFAELWGGNIKGTVKYSTKSNFDLGIATKSTTQTLSRDINFAFSFAKSGFELPLFGLSLKNDIEISIAYTMGRNAVTIFDMGDSFTEEGKPKDGNTRTTIEPRVRYVMSSRVTLSVFYRRSSVQPEGASRIPATTTNEAGLDVHISIQ
ncbi:MAG: cell surface protein SprA [Bacteroidota bacterium]